MIISHESVLSHVHVPVSYYVYPMRMKVTVCKCSCGHKGAFPKFGSCPIIGIGTERDSDFRIGNHFQTRFRNRTPISDCPIQPNMEKSGVMRCCVFYVSDPGACHASRNRVGAGMMEVARADISDMTACLAGQPIDAFPQEILLPIVAIMAVRKHQVDECIPRIAARMTKLNSMDVALVE